MGNIEKISFVVQGPVSNKRDAAAGIYSTAEVLISIRMHYPEAEIILSTWKESDIANLVYDQVILSDDPGGFIHNGVPINNNRLIKSTSAGIAAATNSIVVKTRTDILVTGNQLLSKIQLINPIKSKYGVFDNYVLSTIFYVRNPLRLNLPFHPSDIFLVGTKADLLSYFNVPVAPFDFYVNKDNSTRIVAEQYFMIHTIQKKKNIRFYIPRWGHVSLRHFLQSEKFLFNNFRFLSPQQLGINFPKRLYSVFMHDANYTLQEAQHLSVTYTRGSLLNRTKIARCLKYVFKYYLPQWLQTALRKTVSKPVNKILWRAN